MSVRRVLITVQNRFSARYILDHLQKRQWLPDTEFKIIHILEPEPAFDASPQYGEHRRRVRQGAEALLNDVGKQIETSIASSTICTELREGKAKRQILHVVQKWQPDLVVLGTHGHKGINSWLLGSVARPVSTHAPCSVLVVKENLENKRDQALDQDIEAVLTL